MQVRIYLKTVQVRIVSLKIYPYLHILEQISQISREPKIFATCFIVQLIDILQKISYAKFDKCDVPRENDDTNDER